MEVTFGPIESLPSPLSNADLIMDDIINAVGFGRWTYLYFAISALVPMALVGNLFISEFATPHMNFKCVSGENRETWSTTRSSLWSDEVHSGFEKGSYSSLDKPMLSEQDLLIERRNLLLFQDMEYREILLSTTIQEIRGSETPFKNRSDDVDIDGHEYERDLGPRESNDISNLNDEDKRCLVQQGAAHSSHGEEPEVQPCTAFAFDNDVFGWTVTEEFSLVCDRDWLRAVYQMLFTVGCILGAATGGALSDKHGRQRTIFWGSALACSASLLEAAAPSLLPILVCRLLLGLFTFIAVNPLTTLALEVCPLTHRHLYGPIESLPYAAMLPLLAAVAYVCKHWRPMQLWMTAPLFVAVLLSSPYVMDESPRWLLLRGRVGEAERALRRGARLHSTTHLLGPALHQHLELVHKRHLKTQSQDSTSVLAHLHSLVATAEMRAISFVTAAMWFIEGALYISLPLQATEYQSPFLYLALIGALEIPGALLVAPLGEYLGRRSACSALSFVCACAMFMLGFLRQQAWAGENTLILVSVVAYTALVGVSQMVTILTSELYPTSVRSLGSSMGYLSNNIGNCVPPILEMALSTRPNHSLLVYASLALVNSYLALHLPETNERRLYETVDELVDEERSIKCDVKVV